MTKGAPPRPQKVTLACLIAGVGSLFLLLTVFAELSSWGSLEVREQVQDVMKRSPISTGDINVDQILGWLRVALMVLAAGSAAGVILAVWTARGHRGARIGLTVLAAVASLVFATIGILGLLPAAVAICCIAYLWSRESRAWFAGESAPPSRGASAAGARSSGGWPPPMKQPPVQAPPSGPEVPPAPSPPSEQGPPRLQGLPAGDGPRPSDRPFGVPPAEQRSQEEATRQTYRRQVGRPRSIVIAVVVTSVMAGLVGLVAGANALLYLLSPSEYTHLLLDQPMLQDSKLFDDLGVSAAQLARMIFIGAAACCVLAAAAIGASLLMLRRLPAARIALTVLTGLAIALSVVAFPFGLVWAVGEVFVLVQIYRSEANAWFAAR